MAKLDEYEVHWWDLDPLHCFFRLEKEGEEASEISKLIDMAIGRAQNKFYSEPKKTKEFVSETLREIWEPNNKEEELERLWGDLVNNEVPWWFSKSLTRSILGYKSKSKVRISTLWKKIKKKIQDGDDKELLWKLWMEGNLSREIKVDELCWWFYERSGVSVINKMRSELVGIGKEKPSKEKWSEFPKKGLINVLRDFSIKVNSEVERGEIDLRLHKKDLEKGMSQYLDVEPEYLEKNVNDICNRLFGMNKKARSIVPKYLEMISGLDEDASRDRLEGEFEKLYLEHVDIFRRGYLGTWLGYYPLAFYLAKRYKECGGGHTKHRKDYYHSRVSTEVRDIESWFSGQCAIPGYALEFICEIADKDIHDVKIVGWSMQGENKSSGLLPIKVTADLIRFVGLFISKGVIDEEKVRGSDNPQRRIYIANYSDLEGAVDLAEINGFAADIGDMGGDPSKVAFIGANFYYWLKAIVGDNLDNYLKRMSSQAKIRITRQFKEVPNRIMELIKKDTALEAAFNEYCDINLLQE